MFSGAPITTYNASNSIQYFCGRRWLLTEDTKINKLGVRSETLMTAKHGYTSKFTTLCRTVLFRIKQAVN